jgi:hypothetical protein
MTIDIISRQADELARKYNETKDEEYKKEWYKKVEEIKYFVKEEDDWK